MNKTFKEIKKEICDTLEAEPMAKIDYVEIVGWPSLEPVEILENQVLIALAVYIGKTRLIDNIII